MRALPDAAAGLATQFEPCSQPPQSRTPPQPSLAAPHCTPCTSQVMGVQPPVPVPHWLGTPAPPQLSPGLVQGPQSTTLPQPSPMRPHCAPAASQSLGVHMPPPHWLGPPAPQVSPTGQGPQSTTPPQSSAMAPHSACSLAQSVGVQVAPQMLGPPPPQMAPSSQSPQWMAPPQPSLTQPHSLPLHASGLV